MILVLLIYITIGLFRLNKVKTLNPLQFWDITSHKHVIFNPAPFQKKPPQKIRSGHPD
jgi:hypothetical protein